MRRIKRVEQDLRIDRFEMIEPAVARRGTCVPEPRVRRLSPVAPDGAAWTGQGKTGGRRERFRPPWSEHPGFRASRLGSPL